MNFLFDIPKIHTALAEWGACLAVVLIYRRLIEREDIPATAVKLAVSLSLLLIIQNYCGTVTGLLWFLGMAVAIAVMILTVKLCMGLDWRGSAYLGARMFMWAEFLAAAEWQIYFFYTYEAGARTFSIPADLIPLFLFLTAGYLLFGYIESRGLPESLDSSKLSVSRKYIWMAWAITLVMFGLSNLSYVSELRNPFTGNDVTEVFNIRTLVGFAGVLAVTAFHFLKQDSDRKAENAAIRNMLRTQYMQYKESQENIDMINRKYHDLKHQLQIIREESDDARRSAYLDEIQEGIEQYEAENKTGNPVLDTVLTSKSSQCLARGITMTVVADGTLLSHLQVMDLCTIFGNALDNAIEYESKLADTGKRLIHVTVSEKNNFVCILVENYYDGPDIPEGTLPGTTKKNKEYHGFGLKSIKYSVEKYGGYLNTGVRDGWFRVEMILPKD